MTKADQRAYARRIVEQRRARRTVEALRNLWMQSFV